MVNIHEYREGGFTEQIKLTCHNYLEGQIVWGSSECLPQILAERPRVPSVVRAAPQISLSKQARLSNCSHGRSFPLSSSVSSEPDGSPWLFRLSSGMFLYIHLVWHELVHKLIIQAHIAPCTWEEWNCSESHSNDYMWITMLLAIRLLKNKSWQHTVTLNVGRPTELA